MHNSNQVSKRLWLWFICARPDWSISYGLLCRLTHGKIAHLLSYYIKAIDYNSLWFRGMIKNLGCWKNTWRIRRIHSPAVRDLIYEFLSCSTNIPRGLSAFIIQHSYTVRIPIFWLADFYHVILNCDETASLTSLSWCNSYVVNSTHHCHYSIACFQSVKD